MKKTYQKIFKSSSLLFATIAALAVGGFFVPASALAARDVTNATLNGESSVTVQRDTPITASVTVRTSDHWPTLPWGSTKYKIEGDNWECINTPDHGNGTTATEIFLITSPHNAGNFDVEFRAGSGDDCNNTSSGNSITLSHGIIILKETATLTASNILQIYDKTNKYVTITTSPADLSGVHVDYKKQDGDDIDNPKNAGTYSFTATLNNANYEADEITGTLTIEPKPLTISGLTATHKTYDGNSDAAFTGTATLVGLVSSDTSKVSLSGIPFASFADQNVGIGKTVAVSGYEISGQRAGNYSLTQPTLSADINARDITITADSGQTKVYGTSEPALTYSITNGSLVDEDALSGTLVRAIGENVGEYAINQGTLDNANYAITFVGADFVITPADTTIAFHEDITGIEATSHDGAVVTYTSPTATDSVPVTCVPASGSQFALGTTPVNCDASDSNHNPAPQTTFNVTVQDTTNPVISLVGSDSVDVQVFNSYTELGATVTDNYDTDLTATIDSSAVNTDTVGEYPVYYDAVDLHGNSAAQVKRTVHVVDQDAPSSSDNVSAGWHNSDVTVTFTCTDNSGACAKVYYTTDGNDPTTESNFVDAESSWTFTESEEGKHVIKYFGVDASGNEEEINTATNELWLDKTVPTGAITSPSADAKINSTITITADASDENEYGSGAAKVEFFHSSIALIKIGEATDAPYSVDWDPKNEETGVEDGSHTLYIRVTDNAGNETGYISPIAITVDTVAPTFSFVEPTPADEATVGPDNFTVKVEASELIAGGNVAFDSMETSCKLVPDSEQSMFAQCTFDSLPEGTYVYTATVTDSAGNESEASEREVTIDATGPQIVKDGAVLFDTTTVYVTFDEELQNYSETDRTHHAPTVADFQVSRGGERDEDVGIESVSYNGETKTVTLHLSSPILPSDEPRVRITRELTTIADQYGNITNGSEWVDISADRVAPIITITGDEAMALYVDETYTEQGATATDNVDGEVEVTIGGDTVDTSVVGTYHVTYDASDKVGNEAEQKTRTVTVSVKPIVNSGGAVPLSFLTNFNRPTPPVPPTAPQGQVLGASDFQFTVNLRVGSRGNDVVELQKRLRAEGFFTYPTDTGYFGPITKAAVIAYQKAHGIVPAWGFVGPLTRAELNK
jgi:hypothetical protein